MEKFYLDSIAGYETEKQELAKIIDIFARYDEYGERGARLPKGLILSGEPGIGKTLFAKVLATELDAPFFYVDGSELGDHKGIRKLKAVFARAKKVAPSVVFIDELNTFVGDCYYRTDLTKRNLSALLKLIDGMDGSEGVLVVGASSDKDDLDPALLRSGRMDKHICLYAPDKAGRTAILQHYLDELDPVPTGINCAAIAEQIPGLNGADIKTMVNEAVAESIFAGTPLTDETLLEQANKILHCDINRESSDRDMLLVATHMLGHLVVSRELRRTYDEVSMRFESEVSPNASIRSLFSAPDEDDDDEDEDESLIITVDDRSALLDKVAVLLGGMAAEETLLGGAFTDLAGDLHSATKLLNSAFSNGLFGWRYLNTDTYYYIEISEQKLDDTERLREKILDMFDETAGGRIIHSVNQVGGVQKDMDHMMLHHLLEAVKDIESDIKPVVDTFLQDYTVQSRLKGAGVLKKEDAVALGAVGPMLRASGVEYDVRMLGYGAYKDLTVKPITSTDGDCYGRCEVRLRELFQSFDLIREAIGKIPSGDISVPVKGNPDGEYFMRIEQPRGEAIYYVKGNGTKYLDRFRLRTPTTSNIPPLVETLKGCQLADVPILILTIDPCVSCTER